MDTAAVIARALLPWRWWTNSPTPTRRAARPKKRFEDVEDLLAAGINVISTLNIQHLESLYNVVEGATGVRVKERIPDEFLTRADQIVNIDLPAEDLIERLQAGKIYPRDRIAQALSNFFTPQNLTRLREMALSESANFLDRRQRAEESTADEHRPGGVGQVAVALSSGGPDPGAILRKTARLAAQLNAPWYAVYVRTPGEAPQVITAELQRAIGETLEAAQRMGGMVIVLKREDVAAALIDFAREYGVTHFVVGRPGRRPAWRRWKLSLQEKLLQELRNVDLVVV